MHECRVSALQGDQAKLDALVMMNTRLVALVSNHDSVTADQEKLAQAAEVYRDLLSSVRDTAFIPDINRLQLD